ncbi:PQQ-dependent sugar dehydrogenase [soil metagenome]
MSTHKQHGVLFASLLLVVLVVSFFVVLRASNKIEFLDQQEDESSIVRDRVPTLEEDTIVSGLNHPWEIAFLPDGAMMYTQREGVISVYKDGVATDIGVISGVSAVGEGGLLGFAVDPVFTENRYIYGCYNTTEDVRVSRWRVGESLNGLTMQTELVAGIPTNDSGSPGRHSGCRLAFDSEDVLWITTGDAAIGENPQDSRSLGGKILRVNRDGSPVAGNLEDPYDTRIFSYGHRNVQGIALLSEPQDDVYGVSVEHGPQVDDEINLLRIGNFGWNPVPGYNEQVPMTDTTAFPEVHEAVWSSGAEAIAPSGATFIQGSEWGAWDGALAVAVLKNQHIRVLQFDESFNVIREQPILSESYGRIRTVAQAPDGALYFSTDNGSGQDQIVRLSPR